MTKKRLTYILIFLSCILFVLVNVFVVGLSNKVPLTIDVTDKKFYAISDTTHEILQELNSPVIVSVFASEQTYPIMAKEIFTTYANASSMFQVRYVSPYENPLLLESYVQKGVIIQENDILIEGSNRYKHLELVDLFEMSFDNTQIQAVKAEQTISSALLYVNSTVLPKVLFTKGHNERASESLYDIFAQNNYDVKDITLTVSNIETADIVVIAGPTKDFEQSEIDKLIAFLNSGGSVLVFLEPTVERHENLEQFLMDWQIVKNSGVVLDDTVYLSGNYTYLVPMYAPHPINITFSENEYFLALPQTSAFEIQKRGTEINTSPLLFSSQYAYIKDDINYTGRDRKNSDVQGQFILGLSSEKNVLVANESLTSKVVVFGSKGIYDDAIMGIESYANSLFLAEVASYLTEKYETISIPSKTISLPPLPLTENAAFILVFIVLVILPLCVFLLGLRVYFKRKNL